MPQFTLHRNYILRTTKGHAIRFEKGKPVHVPPLVVPDAVAIGAVPVDPADADVLGAEEIAKPAMTPEERKAKVFKAFAIMKGRGERNDFTASGLPNNKRLPALLEFELTNKERDDYWRAFKEEQQATTDQINLDADTKKAAEEA